MTNSNWFEEKPSQDLKSRIESNADRDIERRSRLAQTDRRRFFDIFSFELVGGFSLAGLAAIFGFWAVRQQPSESLENDSGFAMETLEATEDLDLIADLDLLEDLEILEDLSDEDMKS